jgi:hypothetical protein
MSPSSENDSHYFLVMFNIDGYNKDANAEKQYTSYFAPWNSTAG